MAVQAFRGLKALVAYNLFSQADELGTPELWQAMDYGGSALASCRMQLCI